MVKITIYMKCSEQGIYRNKVDQRLPGVGSEMSAEQNGECWPMSMGFLLGMMNIFKTKIVVMAERLNILKINDIL